jgi:hypothetical protein
MRWSTGAPTDAPTGGPMSDMLTKQLLGKEEES